RRYCYLMDGLTHGSSPGEPVRAGAGDIFLGLDLSSRILPRHPRQIQSWRKRGVRICIFVYDLLPISNPDWFNATQVASFVRWLRFVARHADHALCISQTVSANFAKWLEQESPARRDPIRISTVPLGGDLRRSRPSAGIKFTEADAFKSLLGRDYVL